VSLYTLKPRFQALLRPLTAWLARIGVTANIVTIAAAAGSVAIGAAVAARSDARTLFLLIPVWLLVRMAFNAIDGMLAREFGQRSALGAYLNEIGDVISDAALYAPFALIAPFDVIGVAAIVGLSMLTEFAGVLASSVGASRRYDGPMGKSDRAFLFGALALWIGAAGPPPAWAGWFVPVLVILLTLTVVNRVRAGLREAAGGRTSPSLSA
jgi:CDP-diacylglycerol--glycerol-3-phosphate 3-phosphatidyltransferase